MADSNFISFIFPPFYGKLCFALFSLFHVGILPDVLPFSLLKMKPYYFYGLSMGIFTCTTLKFTESNPKHRTRK